MAVALAIGQIIELSIYCTQGPQVSVNVVHHEINSLAGAPTDQELASYWDTVAFGTGLFAKYPPVLTSAASYRGIGVTIVYPLRQVTQYVAHTGAGIAGGNPMPMQISGLISKRGDLPGPHGRGRLYLPFPDIASTVIDGAGYQSPSGAYLTDAAFIGTCLLTPVAGGVVGAGSVDMTPLILNRLLPAASVTIGGYIVRPAWATQRRRGEFGRPNVLPF